MAPHPVATAAVGCLGRLKQYREVSAMLLVVFFVAQLVDSFGGLIPTRLVDEGSS